MIIIVLFLYLYYTAKDSSQPSTPWLSEALGTIIEAGGGGELFCLQMSYQTSVMTFQIKALSNHTFKRSKACCKEDK